MTEEAIENGERTSAYCSFPERLVTITQVNNLHLLASMFHMKPTLNTCRILVHLM